MLTLSKLIEQTNIPAKLVRATVRQSGGWESFTEHAADITNHGADGGFNGFFYYAETVPFAKRNKRPLLEYAAEMARDLGEPSSMTLIASFHCVDLTPEEVAEAIYNPRSDNKTEVFNALAWFALEEVARAYCDALEGA